MRISRERSSKEVEGAAVDFCIGWRNGWLVCFSSDNPERDLTAGVLGVGFRACDADGSAEFAASGMKLHLPFSYCVTIASPGIATFRYAKLNDFKVKFHNAM
jgi:hypothetical protein